MRFECTGNDVVGPGKVTVMLTRGVHSPLSFQFVSDDGKRVARFNVHDVWLKTLVVRLVESVI